MNSIYTKNSSHSNHFSKVNSNKEKASLSLSGLSFVRRNRVAIAIGILAGALFYGLSFLKNDQSPNFSLKDGSITHHSMNIAWKHVDPSLKTPKDVNVQFLVGNYNPLAISTSEYSIKSQPIKIGPIKHGYLAPYSDLGSFQQVEAPEKFQKKFVEYPPKTSLPKQDNKISQQYHDSDDKTMGRTLGIYGLVCFAVVGVAFWLDKQSKNLSKAFFSDKVASTPSTNLLQKKETTPQEVDQKQPPPPSSPSPAVRESKQDHKDEINIEEGETSEEDEISEDEDEISIEEGETSEDEDGKISIPSNSPKLSKQESEYKPKVTERTLQCKGILKEYLNKNGKEWIETVDDGDCFYDAVAQGLYYQFKIRITHQELRQKVSEYVNKLKKLDPKDNWVKIAVDKEYAGIDTYEQFCMNVHLSSKEARNLERDSIWGRPYIEGVILGELYGFELYTIEVSLPETNDLVYDPIHIDTRQPKNGIFDKRLEIALYPGHFLGIRSSNVDSSTEIALIS